jgi:hypothetical protein
VAGEVSIMEPWPDNCTWGVAKTAASTAEAAFETTAELQALKKHNADLLRMIAELQKRVSWLEEIQKQHATTINEINNEVAGWDIK